MADAAAAGLSRSIFHASCRLATSVPCLDSEPPYILFAMPRPQSTLAGKSYYAQQLEQVSEEAQSLKGAA